MAGRIAAAIFALLLLGSGSVGAQEAEVVPGVVTASNVDVTADDGSLLSDRFNVGDTLYIVVNPKNRKKGWVRVSRTADDTSGFGWVEEKNIRSFHRYGGSPSGSNPAPAQPPSGSSSFPRDSGRTENTRIAVVPFQAADPDDPIGKWVYDAFSMSLKNQPSVTLANEAVASQKKINTDSTAELKKLAVSANVEGVFVGKISGEIAGSRLFQVRYFSRDKDAFTVEKVTKLPKEGNLQRIVDTLVSSLTESLAKSR